MSRLRTDVAASRLRTRALVITGAVGVLAIALTYAAVSVLHGRAPAVAAAETAPVTIATASLTAATVHVSASGPNAGSCTAAAPCSLAFGVANAPAGSTVLLRSGTYAETTIPRGRGTATAPVTVTAGTDQKPVLTRLTTSAPHVDWSRIEVSTLFTIAAGAIGTTFIDMHVNGGGLFVRSADVEVRDSLFENGSSLDGIQVSMARKVVIEGNTIRDYNQDRNNGLHADCIQVFDAVDVTIRANSLRNCYNAGIILSVGRGNGIDGVVIETNFIQGCLVKSSSCNGGTAVDLREPTAKGLVVRNNTILNGASRVAALPGSSFDRNIIGYLADCTAPLTNSIVQEWNRGLCAQPSALGTRGNVSRTVAFVNQAAGDLHVVNTPDAQIVPWGSLVPAAADIDGEVIGATTAGADAPAGQSAPTVAPTPATPADLQAPTVQITAPKTGTTVSGTISLVATATDNVGVSSVSFFAETLHVGAATLRSDGTWAISAQVKGIPAGTYKITARAVDSSGNAATSAPITVTVK